MMSVPSITNLFLTLFSFCLFGKISGQQSPCPHVFDYRYDGQEWFGFVSVPSTGSGTTITIKVELLAEGNISKENSGQIQLMNDATIIDTVNNNGNIEYKVIFPQSPSLPQVVSIRVNKKEFCSNEPEPFIGTSTTVTLQHSFKISYPAGGEPPAAPISPTLPPPIFTSPPPQVAPVPLLPKPSAPNMETQRFPGASIPSGNNNPSWLSAFGYSDKCGLQSPAPVGTNNRVMVIHTIINGKPTYRGEYPWLVAMYDPATRDYICGGSLVSNKHVITAAHCTAPFPKLYLELGKYSLKQQFEEGSSMKFSQEIIAHPDYRPNTGHADIAIIILSETVPFSDLIKPVCIWPYGPSSTRVGTIAGWGQDQSGEATEIPMQAVVDIVDHETCRKSHELLADITSETTFCAGGKNKGPCRGDSGSGMFINMNNRWYLRGIISTSLGSSYSCDVSKFSVYADLAKYLDWLRMYLI